MSRRDPEPGTREQLLKAAIELLAAGGPEALQARRVASEIGASTMGVYTHFGGMPQLVEEIVREGFRGLVRRLAAVAQTDDALADLFALGLAYRAHALDNPQLYRLMFGLAPLAGRRGARKDVLATATPTDIAEGQRAFEHLVRAVSRLLGPGRASAQPEPTGAAAQIWSAVHGYVLLEIAGFFGPEGHGVEQVLLPLGVNLAVGFGVTTDAATRSALAALSRR